MSDTRTSSGGHVVALDGLRGVAAIAVMLEHSRLGERVALFSHGWLAVDFFLCLSGYVIGLAYDKRFAAGMTFGDFALARARRLYPMVWLGGLVGILLYPLVPQIGHCTARHPERLLLGGISQLTLVPMFVGPCLFVYNAVFWSLLIELIANALHFAVFWRLGPRVRTGIVAGLAAILSLAGWHDGWIQFGPWLNSFGLGVARCVLSYLIGYGLYRSRDRWAGRVPRMPFAVVAAVLMLALSLPPIGLHQPGAGAFRGAVAIEEMAFVVLLFPALLALGAASHGSGRSAEALGALSYPLYAIHLPLVYLIVAAFVDAGPTAFLAIRLGSFAAIIVLAWIIAVTIDLPLNRLRHRAAERTPGPSLQAL